MRCLQVILMLWLASTFLTSFTARAGEERPRTITVTGEADIRVAPDQVILSMAVINKEKTLDAAKAKNDATVKALISYLVDTLKIAPKYVQTDYLSVKPIYYSCGRSEERNGECDPLVIQYHQLEKGIQLRLNDLAKYEAVVSKSFGLGVNRISDIQFISTKLREHKDKARELAAIAAKEKASAVAATLDMTLGKPITINLNDVGWSYRGQRLGRMTQNIMQNSAGVGPGGDESSLAVGQINITASVAVSFDMSE